MRRLRLGLRHIFALQKRHIFAERCAQLNVLNNIVAVYAGAPGSKSAGERKEMLYDTYKGRFFLFQNHER